MLRLLLFSLLVMILSLLSSCEYCVKNYTLTGVVRNQDGDLLSGVKIYWGENYETLIAETDENGVYVKGPRETRAGWSETILKFEADGYSDYYASEYTTQEAGWDVCGDITLVRDATLEEL